MSKRCVPLPNRKSYVGLSCILPLILCLLAVPLTNVTATEHASVRIENVSDATVGGQVEVAIDLVTAGNSFAFGGFELLVTWDPGALTPVTVQQGGLLDDCGWEYFNYSMDYAEDYGGSDNLMPLFRVVALAETNNGPVHPTCFGESGGELARLVFSASSDPGLLGTFVPVRFYWTDCTDNTFAIAPYGDTLLISDRVFSDAGYEITADEPFPTWFGAPDTCLGLDSEDGTIERGMDFYHGGVEFTGTDTTIELGARLMVEKKGMVYAGEQVEMSLDLLDISSELALSGFDVLLSYDAARMTLDGVQPGQLITGCEWELFSYYTESDLLPSALCNVPGLVRIVGVADINDLSGAPTCLLQNAGQLATLSFTISSDSLYSFDRLPVQCYWTQCSDNVFTTWGGDTLLVSRGVFDFDGFPIPADTLLPGYGGAPDDCLAGSSDSSPILRAIDCYAGGVYGIYQDTISERGDINLNALTYEIADWVIFADYLYYGSSALTIDPIRQAAASDVNADGIELSLADFVFMYQVILGMVNPIDDTTWFAYDTVVITQNVQQKKVSFGGVDTLAAVILTFDGSIVPELLFDTTGMVWWYDTQSGYTRVVVYPDISGSGYQPVICSPWLFTYEGDGELVEAEAAAYGYTILLPVINVTGSEPPTQTALRILPGEPAGPGALPTASIMLENPPVGLVKGGFDLLLAVDPAVLSITDVQPGAVLEECGWEYFTYRLAHEAYCGDMQCSPGVVRIVALADESGTTDISFCLNGISGELARLTFVTPQSLASEDTLARIDWIWYDCGDNVISTPGGDTLLFSSTVYDIYGYPVPADSGLPAYGGAEEMCLHLMPGGSVTMRAVDFYNGAVNLNAATQEGQRGDINLNGIAFEIADWVTFSNYFLLGSDAFTINVEAQTAASDINENGVVLQVADLQLLKLIIIGDVAPGGTPDILPPPVAVIHQDISGVVRVESDRDVGSVFLIFAGDVTPELLQTQMDMTTHFDGSETRVLITSLDEVSITAGELLGNTGQGALLEVEGATYQGGKLDIDLSIATGVANPGDKTLPGEYALSQNYPNPFNPSTTIEFSLPEAAEVKLEVFDILGRTVSTMIDREMSAGSHVIEWNGRTSDGAQVASGIYLYRLTAGSFSETRRMLLLK